MCPPEVLSRMSGTDPYSKVSRHDLTSKCSPELILQREDDDEHVLALGMSEAAKNLPGADFSAPIIVILSV